ncbi:MAG: sel1 repeat family protein [Gammaproteobacteria bacterium]|nr:sel1 repeat family protein [Gammaproteobacteria bacterium]
MTAKNLLFICITITASAGASAIFAQERNVDAAIAAVENQDYMTAYQIFKTLAVEGDAEAQHNLAILYRQGKGVMQNPKLAAVWFRKAADQGLASAQYYLGHMYDAGEGVEKNPQLAVQWYQKGAQGGDPLAQANLGVCYANGEGINQDIVLAYVWFSLAASQGLTAALENRNLLKKDMSDELLQNAQRLTRDYFSRYVAPFQVQVSQQSGSSHPRIPGGHQGIRTEPSAAATQSAPATERLPPGHGGN